MKKELLRICVLFIMVFFVSCSKDSPEPTPTSLELTLRDELGNVVSGATVKLYSSATDLINGTNLVGSIQYSDAAGKVKFSNLSNIIYYWYAEKDCKNNAYGTITTTTPLTSNVNNQLNVVLSSTGTIKFVNTSSDPYAVYINGTFGFNMNGGATEYRSGKTGSYSIRVLQLSGYFFTPTEETFNVALTCGQTFSVTFP